MEWVKVAGLIRHVLTFGGGYLVARGFIDESTMMDLVAGAMTIIGLVWSWKAPEKQ